MLTKDDIEEFREIWKKVVKKDISYEEAKERATELHELYRAVYLPIEERTFNQKSL